MLKILAIASLVLFAAVAPATAGPAELDCIIADDDTEDASHYEYRWMKDCSGGH